MKSTPCTHDFQFQFAFRIFQNKDWWHGHGLSRGQTWPTRHAYYPHSNLSRPQSLSSLDSTLHPLLPCTLISPQSVVVRIPSRAAKAAGAAPPHRTAMSLLPIPRGGHAPSRASLAPVASPPARTMEGKAVPSPSQPRHCLQSRLVVALSSRWVVTTSASYYSSNYYEKFVWQNA